MSMVAGTARSMGVTIKGDSPLINNFKILQVKMSKLY